MGNPVRYYDPDGKVALAAPLAAGGGGGAAAGIAAFYATPIGAVICLGGAAVTVGGLIWYNWPAIDDPAAEQEDREYKTAYAAPMPPSMDECEVLAWKLKREQELLAARMAWDANWQPGRHAEAMLQSQNAIRNIKDNMKRLGCKC